MHKARLWTAGTTPALKELSDEATIKIDVWYVVGWEAGFGREATEVCEMISMIKERRARSRSKLISCARRAGVGLAGTPCDEGAFLGLGLKVAIKTARGNSAMDSAGKRKQAYMEGRAGERQREAHPIVRYSS